MKDEGGRMRRRQWKDGADEPSWNGADPERNAARLRLHPSSFCLHPWYLDPLIADQFELGPVAVGEMIRAMVSLAQNAAEERLRIVLDLSAVLA